MATTTPSTVYAHITKDPEVCGGKACIDGTRIRVMDIVALEREGYVPEKMLNVFAVQLTLGQVHAALAYYYDHRTKSKPLLLYIINAGFHRRCFGAGHKTQSTRGSSQLLHRPCARIATQTPTAAACFLEPQLMLETKAMSSIRRELGMFSVSELHRVPPGLDPDAAPGRDILSCARADEGGRSRRLVAEHLGLQFLYRYFK